MAGNQHPPAPESPGPVTRRKDKRGECGCHRGCTVLPHDCDEPCRWPGCLTPEEAGELAASIARETGSHG